MIELNGRRLGLDGALADDYAAFHEGVALVDLCDRGRMRFLGAGAKNALNGILTCDVAPLVNGQGAYGVALTSKGKVVADVSVFAGDDSYLVECSAASWPGWQQLVAKYINPRISPLKDETESTASLGFFGLHASSVAGTITGAGTEALEALPPYSHLPAVIDGSAGTVARIPDMGVDGYRLLMARSSLDAVLGQAVAEGARVVSPAAAECARIEAGRPVWGVDMDDSTIPQEANLEALGAISFTKGCYTGQEVVARLHFRGHVNRRLMGLRVEGTAAPDRGSPLTTGDGKECGDVRSSIISPRYGPIALGMVRREVNAGDSVSVRADGSTALAQVITLPFGG